MLCYVQVGDIFGKVVVYAQIPEFQKREFPYAHSILSDKASVEKQNAPEFVYSLISLEVAPESEQKLC